MTRRQHVEARDRGVCRPCGRDCIALMKLWVAWRDAGLVLGGTSELVARGRSWLHLGARTLRDIGFHAGAPFWYADHIIPRNDHGSDGLDNAQTLCHPCHVPKSRRENVMAKGRARRARQKADPRRRRQAMGSRPFKGSWPMRRRPGVLCVCDCPLSDHHRHGPCKFCMECENFEEARAA